MPHDNGTAQLRRPMMTRAAGSGAALAEIGLTATATTRQDDRRDHR